MSAGQQSLARYVVPNANAFDVKPGMVEKFEEMVYDGTVGQELLRAVEYLRGQAAHSDSMRPMGIATGKVKCQDIFEQFKKVASPTSLAFSATIWMLDLAHRLIGIDKLDLARMRWAMLSVADTRSLHKVMEDSGDRRLSRSAQD